MITDKHQMLHEAARALDRHFVRLQGWSEAQIEQVMNIPGAPPTPTSLKLAKIVIDTLDACGALSGVGEDNRRSARGDPSDHRHDQ